MRTKNKTLVLDKVVEFDHFKYMKTKNKTLVLGGRYSGVSKNFDRGILLGLARCVKTNSGEQFVALIYEITPHPM